MSPAAARDPLRVLFLCTGNSARSQIAEALLTQKARGRFAVASAGSQPAAQVHPMTVEILAQHGIGWRGHTPKGVDAVRDTGWDFVITVCDRARESCPTLPGQPTFAHWGLDDPAEAAPDEQLHAFRETVVAMTRRIDLLLALPVEKLERRALHERLRMMGEGGTDAGS